MIATELKPGDVVEIELPFEVPPMTMNEARSGAGHWTKQAKAKTLVADAVMALGAQYRGRVHAMRCTATLTWYTTDYGVRDCNALAVMMKACLDVLTPPTPALPKGSATRAGTPRKTAKPAKPGLSIIDDDNANVVTSETLTIVQGAERARIVLRLDVIEPEGPRRVRPPSAVARARANRSGRNHHPPVRL